MRVGILGEPGGSPTSPRWVPWGDPGPPAEGLSVSMASSDPTSPSSSTQKGALDGFWPTVQANTCRQNGEASA